MKLFKRLTCKHSYIITSKRHNICTHEKNKKALYQKV